MASPPVIVNHSVVRAGTSARATAAGLAAYAGTRRGVVIEVSEADGRRLGVDGLAAYAANVSVNLFFTSFAKQARRSRKGGFTGCANVFSPIPVTA